LPRRRGASSQAGDTYDRRRRRQLPYVCRELCVSDDSHHRRRRRARSPVAIHGVAPGPMAHMRAWMSVQLAGAARQPVAATSDRYVRTHSAHARTAFVPHGRAAMARNSGSRSSRWFLSSSRVPAYACVLGRAKTAVVTASVTAKEEGGLCPSFPSSCPGTIPCMPLPSCTDGESSTMRLAAERECLDHGCCSRRQGGEFGLSRRASYCT